MSDREGQSRRDLTAAALVAVGTLLLLEAYPRPLHVDEALLLYESRRVLAGDVPYRDFHTIFAPGTEWLFAGLFALFGATFDTARHTMAILHGAIAGGMFLIARAVGARTTLALAAVAVHAAAALPQFFAATPHWFGTALLLAVIGCLLRVARHDWRRGAFLLGAITGVLLAFEHPKGVAAIGCTGLVLLVGGRGADGRLWRLLAGYTLGLLVVVGGVALVLGLTAGLGSVYEALVRIPLGGYRQNPQNQGKWSRELLPPLTSPLEPHFGVTAIMYGLTMWLPRAVAIPVVRTLRGLVRTGAAPPIPLVVAGSGLMALGAVSYNPNPVHIATVLPVLAVVGAESAERGLAWLEGRGWGFVAWAPVALVLVLTLQAAHFPSCIRRFYPVPVETAFGQLNDHARMPATQAAQEALFAATSRTVFVYPDCPGLYLTAGLSNPTRFQHLYPILDPPEHYAEAVATLERGRVPYIFRCVTYFALPPDDPVIRYLQEKYEPMPAVPGGQMFRRKGLGAAP